MASNQTSLITKDLPILLCSVAGMLLPEALYMASCEQRENVSCLLRDHSLPSVSFYLAALIDTCLSSPPSIPLS